MRRFAGYALKAADTAALLTAVATTTFCLMVHNNNYGLQAKVAQASVNWGAATPVEAAYDQNAVVRQFLLATALAGVALLTLRGTASALYNIGNGLHSTFCAKPSTTTDATALAAQQQALLEPTRTPASSLV